MKSVPPLIGEGMIVRKVLVRAEDVVYLKGVLDSQEGLAQVFAQSGGDLVIAAPEGRAAELDALLDELVAEVEGLRVSEVRDPPSGDGKVGGIRARD